MTSPDTNTNVVLTADVNQYQQSMGQANDSTNTLLNSLSKLNQATDNLFRHAGRKLELFGAGEIAGVGAAVRSLAALDQQMSQIRANAALTGGSGGMNKLKDGIRDLGSQIPMTQRELVGLATTIQGLGVQGSAQILSLTKTFAQLQAVTGESGAGLATNLIQLTRSMGNTLNSEQVKGYAAAVADLSAKLGTSATGITQFAQAIQPLGKIFGLTENQILGISGAFSKAGADGTAAANAFGQVIQLVTNDLQTGSPQIKQFADILGITTDQLSKMAKNDPTEFLAEFFDSIQKGGKQSLQVLQSLGLDGVRTLNAIQRVSQGGGIRAALGVAQGAKPEDLTKASQAAFSDLNDEITKLGHTLTELMTGPFATFTKGATILVGFIDKIVAGVAKFASMPGVHQLLQAFGVLAGFAGPLLALTGVVVGLIPLLAKLGFAWTAIFSRSGLSIAGGMRDRMAGVEQSAAAAASARGLQGVTAAQSAYYRFGQGIGGGLQRVGFGRGEATGPSLFNRAAALGIRGISATGRAIYTDPIMGLARGAQGYATGGMGGALQSRFAGTPFMPFGRTLGQQFQVSRADISGRLNQFTGGRVGTAQMTPQQNVAAATAAQTKAMEQFRLATLAAAKSSSTAAEADRLQAKAAAEAATANLAGAKATAAEAEASARADVGLNTVGAAGADAAKALLGVAGASLKASVSLAAAGAGGLLRGAGSFLSSAVGGPLGAAFIGFMGYSYLSSRNKQMSQDQLDNSSGTLVGNINKLNQASGGTATSLDALSTSAKTAADNLNKSAANPQVGGIAPWSSAEIAQVTASGYDPKSYRTGGRITTAQQQGQVLAAGATLGRTGSASSATIDQLRKDLLASYGGDKDKAQKVWDQLVEATGNFTHASTDVALNARISKEAFSQITTADAARRNPFGGPTSAQQRAQANVAGVGAGALGVSRAGAAGQDTLAMLLGLPGGVIRSPQQDATIRAQGGVPMGATQSVQKAYADAAKAMGLPTSVANNVNSLRDLIVNILSSDNKAVQSQAQRLGISGLDVNKLQGFTSTSQVQAYLQQQDVRLGTAAGSPAGQAASAASAYQSSGLAGLGIGRGAAAANITGVIGKGVDLSSGNLSGNPAAVAKAAEDMAEAVTKGGASAAQATGKLSAFSAESKDTTGTVQALTNAAQALVDVFNNMQRSTEAPGQALASINAEMASLNKNDKDYASKKANLQGQQQSVEQSVVAQAQQYLIARHQLDIQLERGQQDYQLQVSRSNQQFDLQQSRAQADYDKQVARNAEAFNRQTARSTADFRLQESQATDDYNKQRSRANRDFLYQEGQYVKSVAQSLDPWSQVQAQSTTDAGQLLANLQQQNGMFKTAGQELDKLKKMGLSQNTIDVLGLSDPKNMQQLDRTYKEIAENPQLINTFNTSIKGRLKWTKGLATDESSTQWRDMKHQFDTASKDAADDFDTAMDRSEKAFKTTMGRAHQDYKTATDQNADDFETATQRSVTDFNTQMTNMQTDYETSIKRSLEDVNDFATQAYGTANDIMAKALKTSKGNLHDFFSAAAGEFRGVGAAITGASPSGTNATSPATGSKDNPITTPGTLGVNPSGQIGTYSASGKFTATPAYAVSPGEKADLERAHKYIASPTSVPTLSSGSSPAQNKAWAKAYIQSHYGWGASEFDALVTLWNNESGWRQSAYNAGSGATGIPQALPGSKMASYGADWKTNPETQMKWGLNYIKDRYGDPIHAKNFEFSHSPAWYAAGSIFSKRQVIGVGERGPEAVIPLNPSGAQFFIDTMNKMNMAAMDSRMSNRYASKVQTTISNTHVDSSTNFNGEITVQAQDPNAMANALKNKARMAALTNPDLTTTGALA